MTQPENGRNLNRLAELLADAIERTEEARPGTEWGAIQDLTDETNTLVRRLALGWGPDGDQVPVTISSALHSVSVDTTKSLQELLQDLAKITGDAWVTICNPITGELSGFGVDYFSGFGDDNWGAHPESIPITAQDFTALRKGKMPERLRQSGATRFHYAWRSPDCPYETRIVELRQTLLAAGTGE